MCKPNITTCQDNNIKTDENVCFEVILSDEHIKEKHYGSLYTFGIALSHQEGFEVRSCILCANYDRCVISKNSWVKQTSETEPRLVHNAWKTSEIPLLDLDKSNLACKCPKYNFYGYLCQKRIDSFKYIPYICSKRTPKEENVST
jgi:hypothetical protein